MPALNIERARLPREMRDALKRHILRERQRKKEEADANEADKQRRRAEKVCFDYLFLFSFNRNHYDSLRFTMRNISLIQRLFFLYFINVRHLE